MKRHAGLVPLSRDHHEGLVMARRSIRGKGSSERDEWPTDPAEQVARLSEFFETDLRPHFEAEEACVFPVAVRMAARRRSPGGRAPRRPPYLGSDAGKPFRRPISRSSATDRERRLAAFGELLPAHLHTEERLLFERMPAAAEPGALEAVGARLAERRAATEPEA